MEPSTLDPAAHASSEISTLRRPGWATYGGLFLAAMSTLMFEVLLTRIFSVVIWYHYAFMAISIALFGMTVGAVTVYVLPRAFTPARAPWLMALFAALFATTTAGAFVIYLQLPPMSERLSLSVAYCLISIPFIMSGICICLALTKSPSGVSRLYAADLAGAALGCLLLIGLLNLVDGPTAVLAVSSLAALGAVLFAWAARAGESRMPSWVLRSCFFVLAALTVATVAGMVAEANGKPLLRLTYVKGALEPEPLYEKWNSFSRVTIFGNPEETSEPFLWTLGSEFQPRQNLHQLEIKIDSSAGTMMTGFDGDFSKVEHLKYDITNLAHNARENADVLVIGAGGGRDVLSALAFKQKSVVAVEINENIINAVTRQFGDFTGHLERYPGVEFVNDEARSYITRLDRRFDILQISLIDSFAATAAGAFVLTENSLYTREGFGLFLRRLKDDGILTVSRWYHRGMPGEMYRLISLASESLQARGVEHPRKHLFVALRMWDDPAGQNQVGVTTLLASPTPFSGQDLDRLESACREKGFQIVLTPRTSTDETARKLTEPTEAPEVYRSSMLNLRPPTDNSPFFFHMMRLGDFFRRSEVPDQGITQFNIKAVSVLMQLMLTVGVLTLLFIIVPLWISTRRGELKGAAPLLVYFSAIGLGFMLIEISQLQRLILYLGHPTYSLSVVLFSLLLASGLGSYLTENVNDPRKARMRLLALVILLLVTGLITPHLLQATAEWRTPARIFTAAGMLFPLGLFMGMPFPLGMKAARGRALTPWLWGINGAFSVCASVLAVALALSWGISSAYWVGLVCYCLCLAAFLRIR